ncbi:MAG: hypothetical protein HYS04_08045 [Acidobacteria bacterium]|nr:hypothetical protein [Acidobacteriota bacterium]
MTIQWPATLSQDSYQDLADWLDILKRMRQIVVELFAIIGGIFTAFSLLVFFTRKKEHKDKEAAEGHAWIRSYFAVMWLYGGIVVTVWLAMRTVNGGFYLGLAHQLDQHNLRTLPMFQLSRRQPAKTSGIRTTCRFEVQRRFQTLPLPTDRVGAAVYILRWAFNFRRDAGRLG